MATRQGVSSKAPKIRGRYILGFERRAHGLRGKAHPVDFTADSPAPRVGAGKSGVEGDEWKVSFARSFLFSFRAKP